MVWVCNLNVEKPEQSIQSYVLQQNAGCVSQNAKMLISLGDKSDERKGRTTKEIDCFWVGWCSTA